jgi:hypothetical protein
VHTKTPSIVYCTVQFIDIGSISDQVFIISNNFNGYLLVGLYILYGYISAFLPLLASFMTPEIIFISELSESSAVSKFLETWNSQSQQNGEYSFFFKSGMNPVNLTENH